MWLWSEHISTRLTQVPDMFRAANHDDQSKADIYNNGNMYFFQGLHNFCLGTVKKQTMQKSLTETLQWGNKHCI